MRGLSRRRWLKGLSGTTRAMLASRCCLSREAAAQAAPSRVVTVTEGLVWSGAGWADADLDASVLRSALERGLIELTAQATVAAALTVLFPAVADPRQRYGIKVNCVNEDLPTHPTLVGALCELLVGAGARPENIVVFDRSAMELAACGFGLEQAAGYRVVAASDVGYADETLVLSDGSVRLSRIVTEGIDHLINMPVLKNHTMAGVTLALKNHFGSIDLPERLHGRANDASPGIAEVNAQPAIRDKTRLVLVDALFGTYESGLAGRPDFAPMRLLLATDPVAADAVGRELIDRQRAEKGLSPVQARHIEAASAMELGRSDRANIEHLEVVLHPPDANAKNREPNGASCRCAASRAVLPSFWTGVALVGAAGRMRLRGRRSP